MQYYGSIIYCSLSSCHCYRYLQHLPLLVLQVSVGRLADKLFVTRDMVWVSQLMQHKNVAATATFNLHVRNAMLTILKLPHYNASNYKYIYTLYTNADLILHLPNMFNNP